MKDYCCLRFYLYSIRLTLLSKLVKSCIKILLESHIFLRTVGNPFGNKLGLGILSKYSAQKMTE